MDPVNDGTGWTPQPKLQHPAVSRNTLRCGSIVQETYRKLHFRLRNPVWNPLNVASVPACQRLGGLRALLMLSPLMREYHKQEPRPASFVTEEPRFPFRETNGFDPVAHTDAEEF